MQRFLFLIFIGITLGSILVPTALLSRSQQATAQTSDHLRDQNLGGSLAVADAEISIVTTYNAVAGTNPEDKTEWPRLAIFLNNGGGFQDLNDTADCTKAERPANCGTPNLFADRMIDDFTAIGNGSKTTKVSARRLLHQTGTNEYITKLSFAYYNDYWNPGTDPVTDRNVYIRQVDFKGPDGTVLLSYKPDSTTANFYFNMGVLNMEGTVTSYQNGMNRAFDKGPWLNPSTGVQVEEELIFDHNHPNFNSKVNNRWALEREGSFNIVTKELAAKLIEAYPGTGGGAGGGSEEATLTVRTHFQAVEGLNSADNSRWPRVAVFVNNGDNFDGRDYANCTAPSSGSTTCGTPPAFANKRVDEFEVNTSTFVRNTAVSAADLAMPLSDQRFVSKLSYVYHNDFWNPGLTIDRNVYITKIEVLGTDGSKIKEFTPPRTSSPASTVADAYYFDMGLVTLEDMGTAFDRDLLFTDNPTDQELFTNARWQLEKEGSFNVVSYDLARMIVERYPADGGNPIAPNQCVTSTNSSGGTTLKAGLPLSLGSDLIVSSRASSAIKEFKYAFFNANNLNAAGAPQPYCVTGLPATPDVCPAGTGQLVLTTTSTGGPITAFDAIQNVPTADSILTAIRGGALFSKTGSNAWQTFAPITALPTTLRGEVQAISAITLGDRAILSAWINNNLLRSITAASGYTAQSPLLRSTNESDYNWQKVVDLSTDPARLPGSGPVQAFGEFTLGTTLIQVYWRGNQEFIRTVPIGSGSMPDFASLDAQANGGFTQSRTTGNIPGSGSVQALTFIQTSAGQITEILWRNNQQYSRSIATADFNSAWATTPYATDGAANLGGDSFGSGVLVSYDQLSAPDQHPSWVAQHGANRAPNNLNIAASFVTTDDTQIAASDACTSNVLLSGQLAGDLNKDCRVDIYDYNFALENFNRQCTVGQTCVRTTQEDVDRVIANFGNRCQ